MGCVAPPWALMAESLSQFGVIDMQLMCGSCDAGELGGRLPVCIL